MPTSKESYITIKPGFLEYDSDSEIQICFSIYEMVLSRRLQVPMCKEDKKNMTTKKPLIMVVEDEKEYSDMIARMVTSTDKYEAIVANSAEEALALLKKNKPALGFLFNKIRSHSFSTLKCREWGWLAISGKTEEGISGADRRCPDIRF